MRGTAKTPGRTNCVRIIGGHLRGRKLDFTPEPGLRPTGDRIRETLFNWLQPAIEGSRCLDLFAGSGALGLEAVSRGSEHVVLVDSSPSVLRQLRRQVTELGLGNVDLYREDVRNWLMHPPEKPFDIVFLDPPFAGRLLEDCCDRLEEQHWLKQGALIYIEADTAQGIPQLPSVWELIREKTAGQVRFALARRKGPVEQPGFIAC